MFLRRSRGSLIRANLKQDRFNLHSSDAFRLFVSSLTEKPANFTLSGSGAPENEAATPFAKARNLKA